MVKNCVRIATILGLSIVTLSASGYRIPEQSIDATALSAANVAGVNGADASYYNPANMSFMDSGASMELGLTYIGLSKINFTNNGSASTGLGTPSSDDSSKKETFLVPTFHYVSPAVNDWRFGLSFVAPGGLSKRWNAAYQKSSAEEFTLKILELNPTASYLINDKVSVGFGLRGVYTDGVVKSDATNGATYLRRDMTGDSIDFGYNLALSYKPMNNLTLSSTYRSKVDLTVKGTANLVSSASLGGATYNGDTSVTVPLPASLALAVAYTINKTTIEFVYDRTYWSSYKELDFKYPVALGSAYLTGAFDDVKAKNWKDVNAYRIGVTHQYNDKLKLMAGFAIDKNPAPDSTLGFELPDSDAKLYSAGFDYKINDKTSFGLAYLYDKKQSRTISQTSGIKGTFTNASASLLTASVKYRF